MTNDPELREELFKMARDWMAVATSQGTIEVNTLLGSATTFCSIVVAAESAWYCMSRSFWVAPPSTRSSVTGARPPPTCRCR